MRWPQSMRWAGSSAAAHQTSDFPAESRFTRAFLAIDTFVIMALAFSFAFGNGWSTAKHLGISHYIAPLIQPAVDLAVVGLMVGVRYLAKHGWTEDQLSKPRRWMKFFGLLTLAMNTGESLYNHQWGRAGWDAIGPILLIAWSELGPWLSGAIYSVHREQAAAAAQSAPPAPAPAEQETAAGPEPALESHGDDLEEPEEETHEALDPGNAVVVSLSESQQQAQKLRAVVGQRLIDFNRGGNGWLDNPGAAVYPAVLEAYGPVTKRRVGQLTKELWQELYRLRLVDSPYVSRDAVTK